MVYNSREIGETRLLRKFSFDRYDLAAGGIILLGVLIRLAAIGAGWPAAYNDEGTVGLMALHIAYRGAHPLLYYGQDYMGSLEAYLGAGFFHLLGPSTFALRLGLLVLFALFLLCLYLLTTLLYSKPLALFSLLLLALGAPEVVFRQLMTAGGPPDYFFFTTLLLLITTWLVLTAKSEGKRKGGEFRRDGGETRQDGRDGEEDGRDGEEDGRDKSGPYLMGNELPLRRKSLSGRRWLGYGTWGVVAGLAIWSHLLCLPFVLCAGLALLFFCRSELRLSVLAVLALTLLLGLSPLIIYKVTVPISSYENSLFAGITGGGYREPAYPPVKNVLKQDATISPKPIPPLPGQQVIGTLLVGIPVATSGTALCPVTPETAWPLTDRTTPYTLFCTGVHGAWGLGFVVLLLVAILRAVQGVRTNWCAPQSRERSAKQEHEARLQGLRLMLLAGTGLTLLAFMLYPQASAVTPWNSARYLVGLLIATPAVLYPLWRVIERTPLRRAGGARLALYTRYALLFVILGTCLSGTVTIFTAQVAQARASDAKQQQLIDRLVQKGDTYVYMDYDDCNRISFLSNERIICAALDKGLHPGLDRYFPYRTMVAQAEHPAYVLLNNSSLAVLFEQKVQEQHIQYRKSSVSHYNIYEPERRIIP